MTSVPSPCSTPPGDVVAALELLRARLDPLGTPLLWFPALPSTSDVAAALAEQGAAEGTVVAADMQTSGRGRRGRVWSSPPGAGLYTSVILRPSSEVMPLLTMAAGVAVADGIRAAAGLETCVKWPNDVCIEGAVPGHGKVAGILAEASGPGGAARHLILGVGINVRRAAHPPDVAHRATSIEAELGRGVDRGLVLAECLAALSARYRQLQRGKHAAVVDDWRRRARSTFGRHVQCEAGGASYRGVAEDVDETGALLVRTPSGIVRVISGEVTWI